MIVNCSTRELKRKRKIEMHVDHLANRNVIYSKYGKKNRRVKEMGMRLKGGTSDLREVMSDKQMLGSVYWRLFIRRTL